MVNSNFVSQAQGGTEYKLQKLEGFSGMNASQLLEIAMKVFVNRYQEAWCEANRKMKWKVDLSMISHLDGEISGNGVQKHMHPPGNCMELKSHHPTACQARSTRS